MKIFFDVDGVLIDGWHAKPERRRRWDATIKADLGVDPTAFQSRFFATPAGEVASLMHACLTGKRDLKEALSEVLPSLGYSGPVDAFVAYWLEKDSNLDHELFETVKQLAGCRGAELYVVTGQEHYRAAHLWNALGFRDCFKDILYSAKIGYLKGTPTFFACINTMLAIPEDESPLFFDDQEEVVKLACAARWDACIYEDVNTVLTHPRLQALLRSK